MRVQILFFATILGVLLIIALVPIICLYSIQILDAKAKTVHYIEQHRMEFIHMWYNVLVFVIITCSLMLVSIKSSAETKETFSILYDVIATFFGIYFIFVLLSPRFDVSSKLIITTSHKLRVNVKNRFFLISLHDIRVELRYMRYDEHKKDNVYHTIDLEKDELSEITGCMVDYNSSFYTCYTKNGVVWDKNSKYDRIKCRVSATSSLSGIRRTKEIVYYREDVVYGEFVHGDVLSYEENFKDKNNYIYERYMQIFHFGAVILAPTQNDISLAMRRQYVDEAIKYLNNILFQKKTMTQMIYDFDNIIRKIIEELQNLLPTKASYLNLKQKETFNQNVALINRDVMYLLSEMVKIINQE